MFEEMASASVNFDYLVNQLDTSRRQSHACVMTLETKYAHLRHPLAVGHRMAGWRVCWVGGWDKQRVFFVVMLVRVKL
jgi:hypothetical protein